MRTKKISDSPNPYIIAIGASAGGLEPITDFFDNMPVQTGNSFVVLQHLSPDHKSMMAEILSKHTQMPVYIATDGTTPQPNCVYLLPSRMTMTIESGQLRLHEKLRDHQPNSAIDTFFESLARDKKEKSVAIVLSGTGTDGTKGAEAVKNAGGIVIVQDPIAAEFDGMPNSAISSGYVDLILSPEMMPDELLAYIAEAPLLRSFIALSNKDEILLLDILEVLHKVTGHDFSNYKRPTINRRLARRMDEKGFSSLERYYDHLLNEPDEIKKLCREFLLHVTKFFRDEEAFSFIKQHALPAIFATKEKGESVKVWTVACSTGEEAYSLAMIFDEYQHANEKLDIDVKIFATDISQEVIDLASKGFYTDEQVKPISPERLKIYFTRESGGYRVTPALRKMIVFARHDIAKDPSFSKIDLITCRNMLIYMNPVLQKRIFQKFHFAINHGGFLFLGPSENIGSLREVMEEMDRKWKVYKCISKTKLPEGDLLHTFDKIPQLSPATAKTKNPLNFLSEIFKETLLEEYDYAGVFIDRDFEVKQAIGHFKKFLDFPEGNFNFNLLKLVPADLSIVISTGVRRAIKENQRIVLRQVKVKDTEKERSITVIIKPYLLQKAYMQPFLFIVLKEEAVLQSHFVMHSNTTQAEYTSARIEDLEQELRETKENLQALIEEVESSNEELQSTNEEIISSNEELQSTNEELQSLNEELHTVNVEHQLKIKELVELNDDLNNYFSNTDVGQIFVDRKLIIRKFTPVATRQINLIASDIGRSIVDISTKMLNLDFINDIKSVLQYGKAIEKEVNVEDSRYQMRITPYLRQNNIADGVVINFIDITEITRLNDFLSAVFNSSTSGIAALTAVRNEDGKIEDLKFVASNKASQQLINLNGESLNGHRFLELYPNLYDSVFKTLVSIIETGKTETITMQSSRSEQWFEIVGVKMMDGLVITFNDITERKISIEKIEKGYEALKLTTKELERSNLDLMQFASVASHDLKEPLRKVQAFGHMLKEKIKDKIDSAEAGYLTRMITSANRMQRLIDDILMLSRLSNNDAPVGPVDLNQIIHQILDDLEITIQEKGATVEVKPLPAVDGIVGQMHQLFQNLISNALKFSEKKPAIHIESIAVSQKLISEFKINGEQYHAIRVMDNGIGFDQQYSEKIFGVFQRLEKNTVEGTGIGLAIVKKIIDNHKGFIKAFSEEGKGAEFIILLPKQEK